MNNHIKYISLGLLCAYLLKTFINPSFSINEVLLVGILAGLTVFYESRAENKKVQNLQNQLNTLNEENKSRDKNIDELKTSIASLKITTGFRNISNNK